MDKKKVIKTSNRINITNFLCNCIKGLITVLFIMVLIILVLLLKLVFVLK